MLCQCFSSAICAMMPNGGTDLSVFLAQLIGTYLALVFLGMLLHHQRLKRTFTETMSNQPLLNFTGVMGILLGLLVVLTHNVWISDWPVLITLVGWVTLIQGVLRMFFPDAFIKLVKEMMNKAGYLVWCWLWFIVGIYLMWIGYGFAY
jgi:hypothetical protein